MTVSQLCFWWPWQFWRVPVVYIIACSSVGCFGLMFFSWWDSGSIFCGEDHSEMCTILITAHQGYVLSLWLVDVDLDHLTKVLFVRCLSCKVTPPLLFRTLWKEVIMHSPQLRSRELRFTFLGAEYLHTLFWIILCGRFVYSQPIYLYFFGLKEIDDQVPYVQETLW